MGASQVGMLRALVERELLPDLVIGTSVGAVNGAVVAAEPSCEGVRRLEELWLGVRGRGLFDASPFSRLATAVRTGTALHSASALGEMLAEAVPVSTIEELRVPFQCVAASVERAAEHWFTAGELVPAVLASAAVPGLFPAVEVDGEHFMDGGLVNSIPVGRAVELGAEEIFVLQVGRVEARLRPPRRPWDVALVAFEIARRHRYVRDLASVPDGLRVHVLPVGTRTPTAEVTQLRYRDFSRTRERINAAYEASAAYLARNLGADRVGGGSAPGSSGTRGSSR